MKIKTLRLSRFRNLSDLEIHPGEGLNFFIGKNGQGKTSILEGITLLAILRSFRGGQTGDLILQGQERADISAQIEDAGWTTDLAVRLEVSGRGPPRKTAIINGKSYRSATSYLAKRFETEALGVHAIVFNPLDHEIVSGDPGYRRSYLDQVVSAQSLRHLEACQKYAKNLEQRNAVLKKAALNETGAPAAASEDAHLLESFSEGLVTSGAQVLQGRLSWIQQLHKRLNRTLCQIAPDQADVEPHYMGSESVFSSINTGACVDICLGNFPLHAELPSIEVLERSLRKALEKNLSKEWIIGHTLSGPHRDDFGFALRDATGALRVLKTTGSQGEIRACLIALKLCELALFRESTGLRPVFLLDDFSSELDRERRERLLAELENQDLQVFVTSTERPALKNLKGARWFQVVAGNVYEFKNDSKGNGLNGPDTTGHERLFSGQDQDP